MFCHDGVNFAEDLETFQFYGLDAPEDLIALGPMPGHEKQLQFDMGIVGSNFPGAGTLSVNGPLNHFMHPMYPGNPADQDDLAVMPPGFGAEFDGNSPYSQTYDYPVSRTAVPQPAYHRPAITQPELSMNSQAVAINHNQSNKRKASIDSIAEEGHLQKKLAVSLHDPCGEYHDLSGEPSPYSSFVPTPAAISNYPPTQALSGSPRTANHQYSTSTASQMSMPAPCPYTPSVSPAFTTANTEHSPRAPATPIARPASVTSPCVGANPKLVRTSTISQSSPTAVAPCMGAPGQTHAFNPYTMYSPNAKARLTLDGNLNDIAKNWSAEEMETRRKIIVFTRSQKGNEIFASFKAVSQKDWARQPGTVNCIWWKERNDAYVTSVDAIQLLEELVHVRFTVEEKNRIRRNLEGFKPLTVSKAKPDSEEFFKVIMGFPNPKPRNIEKDVKVFPWRILPTALCKIISKYSASYASTASALSGDSVQLYRPMEIPSEYHNFPSSPAHEFRGPMPGPPMVHTYETDSHHGRMHMPVPQAPSLQIIPTNGPHYEMSPPYPYGQPHHLVSHPHYHHPQHQAMTAPVAQGNPYWNFNYPPPERHIPMPPNSAPPTGYMPRGMIETAEFGGIPAPGHVMHR